MKISNCVDSWICGWLGWEHRSVYNNGSLSSQSHRHRLSYLRSQTQPPAPPLLSTGLWTTGTPSTASRSTAWRSCSPAKMQGVRKILPFLPCPGVSRWEDELQGSAQDMGRRTAETTSCIELKTASSGGDHEEDAVSSPPLYPHKCKIISWSVKSKLLSPVEVPFHDETWPSERMCPCCPIVPHGDCRQSSQGGKCHYVFRTLRLLQKYVPIEKALGKGSQYFHR